MKGILLMNTEISALNLDPNNTNDKSLVAYIDSEFSFTEAFEFLNNSQQ